MPRFQQKNQGEILRDMVNALVTGSDLSDLNDSANDLQLLVAVSQEIDEAYRQQANISALWDLDRCVGTDLDERAKVIPMTRLRATRSVGKVCFSTDVAVTQEIVIQPGTICRATSGILVQTTAVGKITPTSSEVVAGHGVGRDSNQVPVVAVQPGEVVIAVGSVNGFASRPTGVRAVTNTTSIVGGFSQETDDAFRERIRNYLRALARCNVDAIVFLALGTAITVNGVEQQVRYAKLFKDPVDPGHFILYIDDGNGTAGPTTTGTTVTAVADAAGGEEFIQLAHKPLRTEASLTLFRNAVLQTIETDYYVNPADGTVWFTNPLLPHDSISLGTYTWFGGLVAELQKRLDGDPADRTNYPGYIGAGILGRVLVPEVRPIDVVATLEYKLGFEAATVLAAVQSNVLTYINGLGIGEDIVRNELIDVMMNVDGVKDLDLILPNENIPVLDNEIPRSVLADMDIT